MCKTFQNQEEKVFEEVQGHKLDIKVDHPQTTTKHVMQAHGIVELNRPVEPHFWEMLITPAHVFKNIA